MLFLIFYAQSRSFKIVLLWLLKEIQISYMQAPKWILNGIIIIRCLSIFFGIK